MDVTFTCVGSCNLIRPGGREHMSSKPGTSSQTTCADEEKKSRLLHEALTKASAVRASKRMQAMQSYGTTICLEPESSSTSSQLTDVELIKCHPLMPVLQVVEK
ncbi:hypothetical protein NECAME_10854 [Necator americanus]|uniref:Uncharacterized protein n=1 Tax=Necator americanus TaxID=51031 RepID=W2T7Y4_NECAM|nr:hypothetical protein NECAME_10854 [Necator americanus]ETN77729.1 hypothetical protein NECAME_10854 [Necator americanus]